MSTTNDGISQALTVAILVMVLASTPISVLGQGGQSARIETPGYDGGEFDFEGDNRIGCIEFVDHSDTNCDETASNQIDVTSDVIPTDEAGKMKIKVDASISSGFSGEYTIEARADNGEWSKSSLTSESTSLSVENSYRRGSLQYPTIYVRVVDDTTGAVVAINSMIYDRSVTIPSGDESWDPDERTLDTESSRDTTKGATVVGSNAREVRQPDYTTVARFNDNDGIHESFEDKSLPPVRYDRAGAKVSGPQGNILHFENLRQDSGLPAIFRHGNGNMNLGTALYGVSSGEYQKLRVDYGLQTERASQMVQVNLVNSYGEVIDPSMKNAPSRRLSQTTGRDASYFTNRKQYENTLYEDNINTESVEFTLTSAEKQYIADNNDLYVTYSSDNRAYLLLYRTPIISQSVQNEKNENFVPETKYFEEEFNENTGSENVATFNAKYQISGQLNDEHKTFDRKPNEDIEVKVTVDNNGDERVERRIGIYSMSENNKSLYGASAEAKTIDKRTVGVEPQSSKTFTVEYDYAEHEYGNHNVSVIDTTNPDNPKQISRLRDGAEVSKVYVLQPATFKVREVITPSSWLIHDNFNTTVVLQNVGDLSGTGVLDAEFQNWDGQMDIPETKGGKVRADSNGSYVNVTFDSEKHQYSPSYPERPQNGNDQNRPNSPFGDEMTYEDNLEQDSVDNPSKFTATARHPFAEPNERLYESITDSKDSETVRIYKLDITTIRVEDERQNSDSWYASGHGYTNATSSPHWTAWRPTNNYDIYENPRGAMPTFENTQFIYPPYQVGEGSNEMDVTIEVRNNGQTKIGDARVKVRTDQFGLDGADGGIVGTSGSTNIGAFETRQLHVPVVLRNDEGNGGEQTLSAEVRTKPDYIQRQTVRTDQYAGDKTDQFKTRVDVELWADFVHKRTTTPDRTVNEQCDGWNPTDDGDDTVECATEDQERLFIDQFHKNVGGESGELTVDAYLGTYSDPSGHSHYTDFGFFSDPNGADDTNYWNPQTQELMPNQPMRFDANNIPIDEPGKYVVKSRPNRVNYESGDLDQYNDTVVPDNEFVILKVLDITTPEAHARITDTTYDCKSGTCNGNAAGDWSVHEGATVEFDNKSVDNIVVDWLQWEGTPSYNGGERRCHGADHCYSEDPGMDDKNADKITHRVDESDETITLRVRDHPAYGEGAPVNGTGTPNEETEDFPLSVETDTNAPTVNLVDDYHNNPDNSPDSTTVWESYSSTGYEGIEVCFTASSSDSEIGIEADDWSGTSLPGDANEDTRCRTWSDDSPKTATYQAWDFAGLTDTDSVTIDVQHDETNPDVSLSSSRTSRWVDKDHHSSSVTYTGVTDDDETGLIHCGDDGNNPYSWSGDTNGDDTTCSDDFTTEYNSASESGTEFTVELTAEDYHGNTNSDSATITQYEDKTDPTITGTSTSGSGSSGTTVCLTPTYSDSGIGVWDDSGTVCETYNYESPGNTAPDPNPTCDDGDSTSDWESNTKTFSGTVWAEDYHGNYESTSYSITITDDDKDTDYEGPTGDCPEDDDDSGDDSGSGWDLGWEW